VAKKVNAKLTDANSVGFGKPPAHSRFKPGKSGNPNGRPKGALNFATTLRRTLREVVVINENGRRKEITKLEAALKQLVNKAASGDLRAVSQVIGITLSDEQRAAEEAAPDEVLDELDLKVMLKILRRYEDSAKDGSKYENPADERIRRNPKE
jgi:hypothetical protein